MIRNDTVRSDMTREHDSKRVTVAKKKSPGGYGNRPLSKAPGPRAQSSKCVTVATTSPGGYSNRPPSRAPGPLAQSSKCVTVAKNNPRRLEQPTTIEGAKATGTRLRVCNSRQKHAQEARTTDRRRRRQGHWHKAQSV